MNTLETTPIPASLLGQLLDRMQVRVAQQALREACAAQQPAVMPPVQRLSQVLSALRLRDMQAALLSWPRFDRHRLPALMFHNGQWWLAERNADQGIVLQGEQEKICVSEEGVLADAQVLWLRAANSPRSSTASAFSSPAARLVMGEMLRSKRWLVEVLVATLVVNLLAVASSLYAMQVYDRVVPSYSYATLWALSAGMLIVVLVDWLLKYIRARTLDSVARTVDLASSQTLFGHLLSLRLDTRPRSVGTLAAQASGLDLVRAFFSSTLVFSLSDLPFAVMFILFIGLIGGKIAWVYLAIMPFALFFGWLAQHRLRRLFREELIRSTERQGLLVESIQGAEIIQASGAGWRFADTWQAVTRSMADYNIQSKQITSITTMTATSLGTLAYVLALVVGVQEMEAGSLTIGALIASTILGGRVIGPVAQSVQILAQWQHVREALQMVDKLLELETVRGPEQKVLLPDTRPGRLSFEGVRYSYPKSPVMRLALPHLEFRAGDRVLLLGPIGSGKSTLLKVAAGLYRPTEGRIRLGHADLWELDPQVVVDHVAYLPQDVQLFKGTLLSNLALAGVASDARLLEVATQLGIDKIAADNPRSMEMEISEGGDGVSGGQRQLIGLGRVMLAQPTVWLLDEPTASLDSESEARVLEALRTAVRPDDILIIATHRQSLLSLANRVLVLRGGEVVVDESPSAILAATGQKAAPFQAGQGNASEVQDV